MKAYYKRFLLIMIILFSCVGCDQISKVAAQKYLAKSPSASYLGDLFRLQYTENSGAFLSLGAGLPTQMKFHLFVFLTGIAVLGMLAFVLAKRTVQPYSVIAISFIVGGGIGNLIDRLFNHGRVIDFMNIGVGRLRTGIFNVADVAIMLGVSMLIFAVYRRSGSENIR